MAENNYTEGDITQWKEKETGREIFRMRNAEGSEAKELLKMGETNRIVTREAAQCGAVLRLQAKALGEKWTWLENLVTTYEGYQLTIGAPENSRSQFMKVLIAMNAALVAAKKGMWNRMVGGD